MVPSHKSLIKVEGVGSLVKDIKEGDEGVVAPGLSCGVCYECQSGHDNAGGGAKGCKGGGRMIRKVVSAKEGEKRFSVEYNPITKKLAGLQKVWKTHMRGAFAQEPHKGGRKEKDRRP